MKHKRFKRQKFVTGLLTMALALTSCFWGAAGSVQAAADNELNVSVVSEPVMDPAYVTDSFSTAMLKNIFEGLFRPTNEGEIVPAMAESYEMSEDGKHYTFKLRSDATWANGDPVTAHDFRYAWLRILDPKLGSPNANKLFMIEGAEAYFMGEGDAEDVGVKATDDQTLEVSLNKKFPFFVEYAARQHTLLPLNQQVVENNEHWASDAGPDFVGNGPFNLTEWQHNGGYRLEKSTTYWDQANVSLDAVNVRIIGDANTANSDFQAGNLDFIGVPFNSIPSEQIDYYKAQDQLQNLELAVVYTYKLNTTDEFLQNVHLRRALSYGINRQHLIDNVVKGGETPALGLITPSVPGFEEDRGYFKDGDYDRAREELKLAMEELGVKDPSEIQLKLQTNDNESHMAVAQYVQNEWARELGIQAQIETAEINVHFESMNMLNYQVGRIGPTVDFLDAYAYLEHYYSAESGSNKTGWENEEYRQLLDQILSEEDEAKRHELSLEAEALIVEEMPFIPIYYYSNQVAVNPRVKNLKPDGMVDVQLREVVIEE